jgi:SAM-dependent methyltransferase
MIDAERVIDHYTSDGLADRLRDALDAAGLSGGPVTAEQLAPLDQFHSRGFAATVDLARGLMPTAGLKILDIGSGLGGPSRYLAATFGCEVTGIDLSPSYVEAATVLAERAGLADKVRYECADALALPFESGRFDLAWTQHVAMNIADRPSLYAEVRRVLGPAGRLAIYDVVSGENGPLHYPVPWARGPETSFLLTQAAMRAALEAAGFSVTSWIDRTDLGVTWFNELRTRQAAPAPLGLHVVMGPDIKDMTTNLGRNLSEGRAALVEVIAFRG